MRAGEKKAEEEEKPCKWITKEGRAWDKRAGKELHGGKLRGRNIDSCGELVSQSRLDGETGWWNCQGCSGV